jgi:hypothetical protein
MPEAYDDYSSNYQLRTLAGIARSKTSMRPEGRATDTRLEMPASEVPAACPGGEASSLPEVEGEAGIPMTVVSLPALRM